MSTNEAPRGGFLKRAAGAWFAAQLITGVEAGFLTAGLVMGTDLSMGAALAIAVAVGLPLVPAQAWLLHRIRPIERLRALQGGRVTHEAAVGTGVVLGFVMSSPLVVVGTAIAAGLMLSVSWAIEAVARGTTDPTLFLEERMNAFRGMRDAPAWLTTTAGVVAMVALAALALAWMWVGRWIQGHQPQWREALALRKPMAVHLLAALVGGLSLGWLEVQPIGGSQWAQFGTTVIMVAAVPIAQELIFRGFIWDALVRWMPLWIVVVATTALSTVVHIGSSPFPTLVMMGLFLGILRVSTGSLLPGLAAHAISNALGVALAHTGARIPAATAASLAVLICLVAVVTFVVPKRPRARTRSGATLS